MAFSLSLFVHTSRLSALMEQDPVLSFKGVCIVTAGRTYDIGGGSGLECTGGVHMEDLRGSIKVLEQV